MKCPRPQVYGCLYGPTAFHFTCHKDLLWQGLTATLINKASVNTSCHVYGDVYACADAHIVYTLNTYTGIFATYMRTFL